MVDEDTVRVTFNIPRDRAPQITAAVNRMIDAANEEDSGLRPAAAVDWRRAVMKILRARAEKDLWASVADLRKEIAAAGVSVSRPSMSAYVSKLVEQGAVQARGNTRNRQYKLSENLS